MAGRPPRPFASSRQGTAHWLSVSGSLVISGILRDSGTSDWKEAGTMDMEKLVGFIRESGINLLYGILILAVGFFLIHYIMKFLNKNAGLIRLEPTVRGFLINLIRLLLYIVVVLTAASQLGIPLTSIITILASAGVAVSLAMQGALSNLVGGLTLLILKPIKAGEYVKVGEFEGTVNTVGAFYTELLTPDLRRVSLPNSSLTNAGIVNYSREGKRRLDVTFSVGYASDLDRVYGVLNALAARCGCLLPDPAPEVHLNKCADSALEFIVRVWTASGDYWKAYYYLTEEGKRALDQAGIEIPYPQMDVHIRSASEENGRA